MPFSSISNWPATLALMLSYAFLGPQAIGAEILFSTFLGGSEWEHARDVFVDDAGFVYVVGGTRSNDFPTTENAFQRKHDKTGKQIGSGGYCDVFVVKFNASGKLIWSTLIGGPNYDRAYAVEVDHQGYVYVAGRAGPGFPVTPDSFQPTFRGSDAGIYGMQNGFVVKLNPQGTAIEWASFVGVGLLCRDIAVDDTGDVYLPMSYPGKGPLPPDSWFSGAFQPKPGGNIDTGALKVASNGSRVLWATWMGGASLEVPNTGIRIDSQKNVFLNLTTESKNLPTTPGAHDRTHNGGKDAYIAKLSPDGSQLLYGTYFGGAGNEFGNSTHNMAIDQAGNAYLVTTSDAQDLPVTRDVYQKVPKGGRDIVAAKFSPSGALICCTLVGGSDHEGPDGVYVNADGEVFFTGTTSSADFPTTLDAFQKTKSGKNDAFILGLSSDFSKLVFSSYMGGRSYDDGRSCFLDADSCFYVVGSTNGPGWPQVQAAQPTFAGGGGGKELCYQGGCYAGDVIVAKIKL